MPEQRRNNDGTMNPSTPSQPRPASGKRTLHLPHHSWDLACKKAAELNLSTSQLISQLILETVGEIKPRFLFAHTPEASQPTAPKSSAL